MLGLEAQPSASHSQGSSHGLSRIIRLAYFEHPSYVPLLRESYRMWRELEAQSGEVGGWQKWYTVAWVHGWVIGRPHTGVVEASHAAELDVRFACACSCAIASCAPAKMTKHWLSRACLACVLCRQCSP